VTLWKFDYNLNRPYMLKLKLLANRGEKNRGKGSHTSAKMDREITLFTNSKQ
jgi:hypothetical protein